jgi:hypothetical protein
MGRAKPMGIRGKYQLFSAPRRGQHGFPLRSPFEEYENEAQERVWHYVQEGLHPQVNLLHIC